MGLDIPDAEEAIPKPSSRKAKQALSSQEKKKLRKKNQALKKKKGECSSFKSSTRFF